MITRRICECEEFIISGNNSLSLQGNIVFIFFIALMSLTIAALFLLKGYWIILPFAGFEMILLAVVLLYCCHNNSLYEKIQIFEDTVNISSKYRQNRGEFKVKKYWASVILSKPKLKGHSHKLFIRSKGREMEVGIMLEDAERLKLARMLNDSLSKNGIS